MTSIYEAHLGMCGDNNSTFSQVDKDIHKDYVERSFRNVPKYTPIPNPIPNPTDHPMAEEIFEPRGVIEKLNIKIMELERKIETLEKENIRLRIPWFKRLYNRFSKKV